MFAGCVNQRLALALAPTRASEKREVDDEFHRQRAEAVLNRCI